MFVGYYQDNKNNVLKVAERINGQRVLEEFPLVLEYYVQDPDGFYEGYDGKRLKKISVKTMHQLKQHKEECLANNVKTYELNFNLPNKVLYQHYKQGEMPDLHISFIDIEIDRKGYEELTIKELVDKACCPINAISIYNNWQETLYTLMLHPENLSFEEANNICKEFDNTFLFTDEKQLLEGIMTLLDDADVVAGWHSTGFDTPYIVRRIENILGKGKSKGLCVWNIEPRLKDKANLFGEKNIAYEIYGKWFTDYLELYKKHERGKKESYKLDAIAEIELGERKVQHDESLDDMYRQRYKDFILYNRQDTMLVKKFEDKLKYISIHNAQAHDIRCSLESTMGTVSWVDQAIINEAHDKGLIVNDRDDSKSDTFKGIIPPGAYVPTPRTGLCNYIMSFDMNSLYPTSARSLNMSPEVIIAQIRLDMTKEFLWNKIKSNSLYKNKAKQIPDWGAAWGNVWGTLEYQEVMKQSDTLLTIDFESGESGQATAKDIYNMIFAEGSNLCISAFGTIFRTDKMSLINSIFTRWYAQRKEYKKEMAKYEDMSVGVKIDDEELLKALENE